MPDEAWGGSPLPSPRGQWGLCPRWVMLSGGLGLSLCQWEDSCNTPEQRISASHPPVSPTPNSSPAPPGDGHSGNPSVRLGTLGRHKRCRRPQQARAARARPAPRTCVQSPAQPRGLCPPHVLRGRPHLAGCSCALALPRRPRLARTALCSPPACRTAGTSEVSELVARFLAHEVRSSAPGRGPAWAVLPCLGCPPLLGEGQPSSYSEVVSRRPHAHGCPLGASSTLGAAYLESWALPSRSSRLGGRTSS